MLTGMRINVSPQPMAPRECVEDRWSRNIKDDMKTAIELLFQFKEGMDKLHPECSSLIEKLLQNNNKF